MLISVDGIDGCGKSTQVALLAEAIGAEAIRQISDSRWGLAFRAMGNPTPAQQLALFTADRAVLSDRLHAAAGSADGHLVSDRSYLSGMAYQSFSTGLTPEFIGEMNRAIVPAYDLQLYLRIPVETAFERIRKRGLALDWCEQPEMLEWATKVFDKQVTERAEVVAVDGIGTIEEVHARVMAQVRGVLPA